MKISRFAASVGLSQTGAIDELVRELRGQGREVFNFGVGQPDFPTPAEICEAGITAIREQKTRYTSPMGTLELREAVAAKLHEENHLTCRPSEILISSGAKHALHNMLAATVSPGEEVLLPTPAWVSYPSMIRLLGAEPRFVPSSVEEGFRVSPDALRKAVTPRTVGLVLNSPCNPTGAAYSESDLRKLAGVIDEFGLWVITDEIYERILFDGRRHASLATVAPALRDRIAVVNGVSKAFSMTGWRIGYAAGPEDWIRAASAIQSHQSGNPCSISQEAARFALRSAGPSVEAMRVSFEHRRDLVMRLLDGMAGCELFRPEGTFYVFPRIASYLGTRPTGGSISTDVELVSRLLEASGVATVPGTAFTAPGHLRISFAAPEEILDRGLRRLREALERLGPIGSP